MICPKCHAEYLDHIQECGECLVPLIDACNLDLPIPKTNWCALPTFQGKIYADMAAEILDKHSIPYYLKMDWALSAYNIGATNLTGQIVRIFVPEKNLKHASELTSSIIGEFK